jgi:tetratricopeptide (TPR) repeat protein
MQPPDSSSVLGDFDDATFEFAGVTSTFFRREGDYFVRTDGPDGKMHDYRIAYTVGVRPLQQYLVERPGGRLQALGICWDARPRLVGGQRWFHLYPGERVDHQHPLHWTAPTQNWNHMCAECHSTNLQKNYRSHYDRFETAWSEVDVSCEACHGPASVHLAWAREPGKRNGEDPYKGLLTRVDAMRAGTWLFDEGKATARLVRPLGANAKVGANAQAQACGPCHSRRTWITGDYRHGAPLEDTHRISLLEPDLDHVDGQAHDEIYAYNSFLQSRMHRAGVTCTDCHDPHSTRPVATGNTLCARCHSASVFDSPLHHHHRTEVAGSRCVTCHMPFRDSRVVDVKHDHGFRVPRPDLSREIHVPNACNACHDYASNRWVAAAVREWFGSKRQGSLHFGEALYAGRHNRVDADTLLQRVFEDSGNPGIVRASALNELCRCGGPRVAPAVARGALDPDPLVRRASAGNLDRIVPSNRIRPGMRLLRDSIRSVRFEAVASLAGTPVTLLSADQLDLFERTAAEFREVQRANADRADALVALGNLEIRLGRVPEAEAAYRRAIARNRFHLPAYLKLADLLQARERDDESERLLLEALDVVPDDAEVHHTLGIVLGRVEKVRAALEHLATAVELRPSNPRYAFVYGAALYYIGDSERSLAVLEEAHTQHPSDCDLLAALVHYNTELERTNAARQWEHKLRALFSEDSGPSVLGP